MIPPLQIERRWMPRGARWVWALAGFFCFALSAGAAPKKNFDVPEGPAAETLKVFSAQSGEQIVYPADQIRNLETNRVRGKMTPRAALDAMLDQTGLVAVQDDVTGALGVRKRESIPPPERARREVAPAAQPRSPRAPPARAHARFDADEVILLSPFEVRSPPPEGYTAASSLAGTRLNTELRDVGSAISVVTAEFMRDVGATSNETLLQYTTNTEVGGVQGTMANAGSGTQLDETSSFVRPNSNTRVRGLAAADNTRDFFITDIPWDSYNVERVDFQRGPNAILFGLGSPAGIINAGTRPAGFKNEGAVEFRYGRFGTRRTTLDLNHVLLDRELSIRLDALLDEEKFQQKPAFERDRRVYGALRYEPRFLNRGSARTIIKANFEAGRIDSNRPRSLTPGDALTPWFLPGTFQGFDAQGNPVAYLNMDKKGFDATTVNENSSKLPGRNESNSVYGDGTPNPYFQPWLGGQYSSSYFANPLAVFDQADRAEFRLINISPTTPRGISPSGAIDQGIGGLPPHRNVSVTIYRDVSKKANLYGAKFGLTRNLQLTDPTVFDFYNQLLDGPNKAEWQRFRSANLNVAQTFLNGKLGGEVVYDQQHHHHGRLSFMTDKGQTLFVDVMNVLGDGTPNPNFGRPFIADSSANNQQGWTDRESLRLTAYLRHDFNDGRRSRLTRLLGRHVLTGLNSEDTVTNDDRVFSRWVADTSYSQFVWGEGTIPTISSARRNVYPAIYLGPSLLDRASAAGARIPAPSVPAIPSSGSIRVFDSTWAAPASVDPADPWINSFYPEGSSRRMSTQSENPANYRGLVDTPISILDSEAGHRDELTRLAQKTRTRLSSRSAIWQGHFWDGAVVGMFGYRKDISRGWARAAPIDPATGVANLNPSVYTTDGVQPLRLSNHSNSWSVVAHLSELIDTRTLPLEVSLFYNESSNFQPNELRVDPLGQALEAPTGHTRDVGVLLATRDQRYSLKVNRYESAIVNATGSGMNAFYLGQLFTDFNRAAHMFRLNLGGDTLDTANTGDPTRYDYQPLAGQTPQQAAAAEARDVAGWMKLVDTVPKEFLTAWQIDPTTVGTYRYVMPIGFAQPEDNVSRGYEIEFFAQPVRNLRVAFNMSKASAVRSNVGGAALNQLVDHINTALNTTPAGMLRGSSSPTASNALHSWNSNFFATWNSLKTQEGANVPELREWRFNLVANYSFREGLLKGFNVGVGYRWQDKVVIGYPPTMNSANHVLATEVKFDLDRPYYGPAENNLDLWLGYERELGRRFKWRVQLNARNVGEGNSLIPVTVQPDGTPAGWRIAPAQMWTLTNTLSF